MSLTANQIELVKATVPVLRENGVVLTSYFYNRMLTNHPELKQVFNLDTNAAVRKLFFSECGISLCGKY